MKRFFRYGFAAILLAGLVTASGAAELRDWRATTGEVMTARLVGVRDGKVELQTRDGRLHVLYTTNKRSTVMLASFDESAILGLTVH